MDCLHDGRRLPMDEEEHISDYDRGYIDGLKAFAWWKDGRQLVGTSSEMLLKDAVRNRHSLWNYAPNSAGHQQPDDVIPF